MKPPHVPQTVGDEYSDLGCQTYFIFLVDILSQAEWTSPVCFHMWDFRKSLWSFRENLKGYTSVSVYLCKYVCRQVTNICPLLRSWEGMSTSISFKCFSEVHWSFSDVHCTSAQTCICVIFLPNKTVNSLLYMDLCPQYIWENEQHPYGFSSA